MPDSAVHISVKNFHPQFTSEDIAAIFIGPIPHNVFDNSGDEKDTAINPTVKNPKHVNIWQWEQRLRDSITSRYQKNITPKTPNPVKGGHALRNPDRDLWATIFDTELNNVDVNGTIKWL